MMDYYDLVLGLIPLSVAGIAVLLVGIGIELFVAVSAGSLFAAFLIGHAMFVRTPGSASAGSTTPQSTDSYRSDRTHTNTAD